MSVGAVSEALRALVHEQLVDFEPSFGARVKRFDLETVRSQHVLRIAIECEAIRRCTDRITDRNLEELKTLAEEVDRLTDIEESLSRARRSDLKFHLQIADLAGVPSLVAVLQSCHLVRLLAVDSSTAPEAIQIPNRTHVEPRSGDWLARCGCCRACHARTLRAFAATATAFNLRRVRLVKRSPIPSRGKEHVAQLAIHWPGAELPDGATVHCRTGHARAMRMTRRESSSSKAKSGRSWSSIATSATDPNRTRARRTFASTRSTRFAVEATPARRLSPAIPDSSLLILAVRQDGAVSMPPKTRLPQAEIDALAAWIKMGAPWPSTTGAAAPVLARSRQCHRGVGQASREFWAFQPFNTPSPPTVADANWPRTPIDRVHLVGSGSGPAEPCAPGRPSGHCSAEPRSIFWGLPPTAAEIMRS